MYRNGMEFNSQPKPADINQGDLVKWNKSKDPKSIFRVVTADYSFCMIRSCSPTPFHDGMHYEAETSDLTAV